MVQFSGSTIVRRAHPAVPARASGRDGPGRRKPRRWVVERTFGWLSKCRGILVRYEKKDVNYLGLIQLACGLLLVPAAAPHGHM